MRMELNNGFEMAKNLLARFENGSLICALIQS